jgi:hypothetical protein
MYKIAPIEPTEEMIKAVMVEINHHLKLSLSLQGDVPAKALCEAMLASCKDVESEPACEIKYRTGGYNYIHWYVLLQELKVGTKLYTSPQPDRVAELEAKLATVEAENETLRARVAELESGGWIACSERLPADSESPQMYLINNAGFITIGFFYSHIQEWTDSKRVFITRQVTHWQPLPHPPKK